MHTDFAFQANTPAPYGHALVSQHYALDPDGHSVTSCIAHIAKHITFPGLLCSVTLFSPVNENHYAPQLLVRNTYFCH